MPAGYWPDNLNNKFQPFQWTHTRKFICSEGLSRQKFSLTKIMPGKWSWIIFRTKPVFQNFISSGCLKIYGKTPHQYLTSVRMENAKILLNKTDIPVSETCYAVGFESVSSFSGLFRNLTGLSPSEYLQQQQKIKDQMLRTPLRFIPGCFAEQNGWTKIAILKN